MSAQPERLFYSHDKFVDRAYEVRLLIDKARRLAAGSHEENRVVIFHGMRGAGKTWLLHEIGYQLKQTLSNVLTVYLDLGEFSDTPVNNALQAIVCRIRDAIESKTGPSPFWVRGDERLEALTGMLLSSVRRMGVLVLLFDYVDESPHELLALLEDRCLAPLAVLPSVLIILAGRGREYIWKSPELRLKSEERDLAHFDLPSTLEQLKKQVPQPAPPADEIQPLSAGYPWSNYILGANPANRADALDKIVEYLLSGLPVSKNDRDHLEALCVLRMFSDEMIPSMFAAYFNDPTYQTLGYRQRREARQALVRAALVRWGEQRGGYQIDEALSHVLENRLYERDRATWERLHTAARDLFREWTETYPRTAARWQKEVEYHKGRLTHGPLWTPDGQEEKQ